MKRDIGFSLMNIKSLTENPTTQDPFENPFITEGLPILLAIAIPLLLLTVLFIVLTLIKRKKK